MKKYLLTFFLLCGFQSAHAEIIDNDSFTTDTTSGLDWLDVTLTTGLSYNDVTAQLGSGGSLEGWRYASMLEISTLVVNTVGSSNVDSYGAVGENATFDSLIQLLGPTFSQRHSIDADGNQVSEECNTTTVICDGNDYYLVAGLTADSPDELFFPEQQFVSALSDFDEILFESFTDRVSVDAFASQAGWDVASASIGSFLVRTSSVPEPSSLALLGLGMIGLLFGSRRRLTA